MAIATPNCIGGYDHNFVDNPHDRYICNVCHLPSRDPYLSVCCGHLFCKSCLDNVKKAAAITNACPVCRDEEFVTFPNKAIDREIKDFHIYCTNKKKGCKWEGELNSVNNHLRNSDGCQFEEVKCSNECGKMIQRRYLTSHVETECPRRKVNCQYCHDTGEHQFIEGQHKVKCPKLPLPCPNKCEVGSVPREGMEQHRKECPLEIITCPYHCGENLKRQLLASHLQTSCPRRNVNCRYCHDTGEHQFIEGQHKEKCFKLPLPCPNKCEVGSVPREGMEQHRKECPLEIITCSYYCGKNLKRQLLASHLINTCPRRKVNCRYCHDTGEHQFIEGQHIKEECPKLPLPCPNKCEVESVPREDMKAHRKECPLEIVRCEYYSVGCNVRMARKDKMKHNDEKMKDHLMKVKDELTDTKHQLSIALQRINKLELSQAWPLSSSRFGRAVSHSNSSVQWANELAAISTHPAYCPIKIKMSGYDCKRRNNVQWYSDPFYTHNKGYKMCLRVHAGGSGYYGKGTHLSVYLCLMKGPHDDELTWPLRGKFEVKLLNQISDSKHHTLSLTYDDTTIGGSNKRVTSDGAEVGWSAFISNDGLNKVTLARQLIKNDCLFFQVTKL